jgi:hypothetical protein
MNSAVQKCFGKEVLSSNCFFCCKGSSTAQLYFFLQGGVHQLYYSRKAFDLDATKPIVSAADFHVMYTLSNNCSTQSGG